MVRTVEPSYINHDGGSIYSIDAHPSGSKFITCGQKEKSSSGVVMVWNMSSIESEKSYNDSSVPKILCQIFTQAGANCVRWSTDGKRFAVGSDDFTVSIWEFIGRVNSAGSVLGKGASVERYKEIITLRNHTMEVLSVDWSQNGKYLATSSMDSMIYIWNAKKLPERVAALKGHTDSVKGISWDPIGKYLASISSDKSLKLWQTDSWECSSTISEPFKSSGQKTMFTRLDWSPDGKYLFAPSSTNNTAPTVQIIERQTWNVERDLVGHRKTTTCVRALPRILCAEHKNGKKIQFCCVATGSRDKGISIWLLPQVTRPLLVMKNIFRDAVMDLMWNGLSLTACSHDGTIFSILFDEKTLGETLTASMMSDLCHKMYCIRPPQYEETMVEDETKSLDESVNNHEHSFSSSFVTCPEDVIAKRKRDEESTKTPDESVPKPIENETENSEAKEQEKRLIEERSKQVEEVMKNGKRRIQPIFLASTSTGETLQSVPVAKSTTTKEKAIILAKRKEDDGEDLDEEDDSDDEDEDEEEEEAEDEDMEVDGDDRAGKAKGSRKTGKKKKKDEEEDEVTTINFKKPALRPTEHPSMRVSEGTVVMDAPEKQVTILHSIQDRKNLQLEIDNKWRHAGVESTCVKLVKKKAHQVSEGEKKSSNAENVWTTIIGAVVINVAANKHICLFGCGDRCLRVYLTDCGSLVTCIRLDSLPVSIGVRDYAGYVLTEYGKLSTWDFQSQKSIISRQPIFECVETSNDTSLASLDIGQNGIPLILLSNGSIYTYNIGMSCWIQVATSNTVSKFFEPFDESQLGDGPLGRLLRRMRRTGTHSNVATSVSKCVKESQIEQLLHCAEILANSSDYRSIISLYVETLCDNGSEKKLQNLFSEMSKSGASILVCGLRRAAILEDLSNLVKTRQPVIANRILSNGQSNNKKLSLF